MDHGCPYPIRYYRRWWIHRFAPTGSPHATLHFRSLVNQRTCVEHNGESIVIIYDKDVPSDYSFSLPVLPCLCRGPRVTRVSDLEGPVLAYLAKTLKPQDAHKFCAQILGFVELVAGGPEISSGFDINVYVEYVSDLTMPAELAVEDYLHVPVEAPIENYLPYLRVPDERLAYDDLQIQLWLHDLTLLSQTLCELLMSRM